MKTRHVLGILVIGILMTRSAQAVRPTHGDSLTQAQREVLRYFDDQRFFLCCTLRFALDGTATDANLRYVFADRVLPAGTAVQAAVVAPKSRPGQIRLVLRPVASDDTVSLTFRYGKAVLTPVEYFKRLLLKANPAATINSQPAELRGAILKGRLKLGMSRDQALMARGYPPAHRTPDLAASEWIYYVTNGLVESVRFGGDRIAEIEMGPAP